MDSEKIAKINDWMAKAINEVISIETTDKFTLIGLITESIERAEPIYDKYHPASKAEKAKTVDMVSNDMMNAVKMGLYQFKIDDDGEKGSENDESSENKT